VIVPSSACDPSSAFVPYSVLILGYSSYDDSEDENPPLPAQLLPYESIEPEPAPLLFIWVRSTLEAVGNIVGDPLYQCRTRSQFQQASSFLAQVSENHDPERFA
jgi:hypothetical protein